MEKSLLRKIIDVLIRAVLFIFCAVPGAFIVFFSTVIFLEPIIGKNQSNPRYLECALAFIIGSALVFLGLGKIKKPLYLLVIWSFPLILVVPVIIVEMCPAHLANQSGTVLSLLFIPALFIVPLFVKQRVDKYYEKRLTLV